MRSSKLSATQLPPTQLPPTQLPPTQLPPTQLPPTQLTPAPLPCSVVVDVPSATITVAGEIDCASAGRLADAARSASVAGPIDLTLSLSQVTFFDSAAAWALVQLRDLVTATGHRLRVVDAPQLARRVLQIVGAEHVLADTLHP